MTTTSTVAFYKNYRYKSKSMKEVILDVMAAGTLALSPHHTEHPAVTEQPAQIEVIDSQSQAPAALGQSEQSAAAPIDSMPPVAAAALAPDTPADNQYNLAIVEAFDPDSLTFWLEAGGIGTAGLTTLITNRQLKKSLRRNHEAIVTRGWNAQRDLKSVLDEAEEHARGLKDDDFLEMRKLVRKNKVTIEALVASLGGTGAEYSAERKRFFASKTRLEEAPNTSSVLAQTKAANKQIVNLRKEVERVGTAMVQIGSVIERSRSTVASLDDDFKALELKGWNVDIYKQRGTGLAIQVGAAKTKWDEYYVDEPTRMANDATAGALQLKEDIAALEPRRAAADEAYAGQSERITEAEAVAKRIRERYAKMKDAYHEGCLVGFKDVEEKLTKRLGVLTSAHETGSTLTGEHGKSVEAVDESEKLNASFDEALKSILGTETNLQQRGDHLRQLTRELPRRINELSILFDRAKILADSSDVEDTTAAKILSFAGDVTQLATTIDTSDGQKPNYLDAEQHYSNVADTLENAFKAATTQRQEMYDLRADVPELIAGYNGMLDSIKAFANQSKVRLQPETRQKIAQLQNYASEMAPDRKNLRKQHEKLTKLVKKVYRLTEQAYEESEEDSPFVAGAKAVGVIALGIAGIELLGS